MEIYSQSFNQNIEDAIWALDAFRMFLDPMDVALKAALSDPYAAKRIKDIWNEAAIGNARGLKSAIKAFEESINKAVQDEIEDSEMIKPAEQKKL